MRKRSINPMFNLPVLAGEKITTIRENPWPVGKDIMLYNWTGAAYRSKQKNIAAVRVLWSIAISVSNQGRMEYTPNFLAEIQNAPLYQVEGFKDQAQMDEWFQKVIKPGETRVLYLNRFTLCPAELQPTTFLDHSLN